MPENALFAVDEATRIVRGRLLPFDEESRRSVTTEPVMFSADAIDVPLDPDILTFNRDHNRFTPIGRAVSAEKQSDGVYAAFRIARTPEGDQALDDIKNGRIRGLSAEVADLVREGGKALKARLTGAALVPAGAFAGAHLFALAAEAAPAVEVTEIEHEAETDPQHLAVAVDVLPTDITVNTPEGDQAVYTPAPTPAEESETEGEFAVMTSIVPDGVVTPEAESHKIDTSASALFAALAQSGKTGDKSNLAKIASSDNGSLFAAYAPLNDVTATAAAGTFPPQFIGEVYKKDDWLQTVLPLFMHDDLKALTVSGWAWGTRPTVGAYAGDKAAIPTNTPTFNPVTTTAERIAGGHDVDRALRDFGNEEFWSSYFRIMVEEYKKIADAKVFAKIAAAPGSGGAPVITPTAVTGTQDPGTMAVIDGALAVIAAGYTPTFALVSPAIFRSFLVTPKDKVLEYLSSAFSLDGAGSDGGRGALGGFKIVPNTTLAAKRVIVGSRNAATVYELPGSPIRVEGLDVAHAGIDPAVYGYVATIINDQNALASVTTL